MCWRGCDEVAGDGRKGDSAGWALRASGYPGSGDGVTMVVCDSGGAASPVEG